LKNNYFTRKCHKTFLQNYGNATQNSCQIDWNGKKNFLPEDLLLKVKNGVSLKNNHFTGKSHITFL